MLVPVGRGRVRVESGGAELCLRVLSGASIGECLGVGLGVCSEDGGPSLCHGKDMLDDLDLVSFLSMDFSDEGREFGGVVGGETWTAVIRGVFGISTFFSMNLDKTASSIPISGSPAAVSVE